MKFATALLLAMPLTEASRLYKNELAAAQDNALVQFTIDPNTNSIENETVASDFASFLKAWGIDFRSTWWKSGDAGKSSLWTYLGTISTQLTGIHNAIGLHEEDHGGALVTLKDYIVTLRSEIKQDMVETTNAIIAATGEELHTLSTTQSSTEARIADSLHEVVNRVRFLTERIKAVEGALGIGYIDDAGLDYQGYVTGLYPLPETHVQTPVVDQSGVTTLAQTSDRTKQKKIKMPKIVTVSNK